MDHEDRHTFHGDAARTGVYPAAGPLQLNGTKWTFKTDGPIISSPAIADGVVYIGTPAIRGSVVYAGHRMVTGSLRLTRKREG